MTLKKFYRPILLVLCFNVIRIENLKIGKCIPLMKCSFVLLSNLLENEYDFIVIGSGASGSVVASRLSEISSWKVLLLEAGKRGNFLTSVPIATPLLQFTQYNWNYSVEPSPDYAWAMKNRVPLYPRGKALGGSTVINSMMYTRGNPWDYQKWANLGNDGWSYDQILPYFLKAEKCRLGPSCTLPYHNTTGAVSVEYPYKSKLTDAFLQAGVERGERIVDYSTTDYMGFSQIQANQKFGRRNSVADAYIYPVEKQRKNLRIVTSAFVTKILVNEVTKEAYGVQFTYKGKKYKVKSTKEVILSAGTFNSPQLLMLSGIGPKEHLAEFEILPISDLPAVGQGLYDHIAFYGLVFIIERLVESFLQVLSPLEIFKWFFRGKGFYTSLGGLEALAYINTGSISEPNIPDIELIFVGLGSIGTDSNKVMAPSFNIDKKVYKKYFKPVASYPQFTILPELLHPKSKGYVKLRSKNPFDHVKIYGNFLSDPEQKDLNTLVAGIRYVLRLIETKPFEKFGTRLSKLKMPGCEQYEFNSDDYWRCCVKSMCATGHHPTGTCKMGLSTDQESVVDARLRVHGIQKLRVVDASIMPVTLSGHTSAPCTMIAEKASDIIKQDYGKTELV